MNWQSSVFAICLLTASLAAHARADAADRDRPNIIFIMADDMGYGDLGCYGQQSILTPNIDRLAEEGTRFTSCYAGSTVCAPSRSVLMTGLHTGHTRVRGNTGRFGVRGLGGASGRVPLAKDDLTVAEVLQEAGYATGMTGKWGLGEPDTTGEPNRQGFDSWFGYLNQRRAHSYYPDYLWLDQHRFPLTGNLDGRRQQYSHDLFTGFAMHFIEAHHDQPFFLYVPYTIPHDKFEVPDLEPYADRDWPKNAKTYASMITRMDADVGRITRLLEELEIDESTIVFFCSDNGAANRYEDVLDSSGVLRGRKRDMYEGGLRTPMIVRWPGHVPTGRISDAPWYFADVLPTAAALAGVEPPADLDGVNVLPTLRGESQELADRFLYWEFFERGYQQAARWQHWKAIRPRPGAPLELYDLESDLSETTNVAAMQPEVVAKFEEYLATARTDSENWPVPAQK